ncbi:MAG: alpha/beta fold hydrolase [Desulfobacterales bacterium]|nr:alpha/beta fold hydrolase [Desulfobacterales bacterium]
MTRFKRRLLIGLALATVVLAGLGAWFYHFYFRSTGAITRHMENFRFRRMTVAQLAEQSSYRFFFITNRKQASSQGPIEAQFGTEREAALKFGYFDTRIQPSLGLGMLIDPTEWFQNEEIQLNTVARLERERFVEEVRQVVKHSPHRSLLVVVHGFRERFPSALRKTAFLSHVLDINTPVLVFDWPGNQGSSLGGYRRARQVAEASGEDLARTLELVIFDIRPARLWLLANSMGGQVVADAFGLLHRNPDLADTETEIEDVVLTAPDVDHAEFNAQFKQEIQSLARHLTVYVSSNDRALLVSRLINRGKRGGESSLSRDMLAEAERIAELVEPDSDQIALVDVTPVNRTRNFHNFSLETPEFFDDLFLRLTNDQTPRSRRIYQVRTPEGKVYWVLTRGR